MTVVVLTALLFAAPAVAHGRPVQVRIEWLQQRVRVHQFGCRHHIRHGNSKIWHCLALAWSSRELREARAEQYRRDWAIPPEPYLSIARCEQHDEHGLYGIKWDAYSSSYEGAYGFLHSTWRENRSPWMAATANLATAREQLIVAQRLHARYGWSPWPACHIRLGLR